LAERAVEAEKLGADDVPDVLSVSFSSNDYVGHEFGPDDPRVRDISIRTDRIIGRLFSYLDKKVGMASVLVVMSADHGVSPMTEKLKEQKMPGGRFSEEDIKTRVRAYLDRNYGVSADWLPGKAGHTIYLNHPLIESKGLDLAKIRSEVAAVARQIPHVARVYTYDQLAAVHGVGDPIDRRVHAGFFGPRAADVFLVSEPYWVFEKKDATHGSPHNYDAHVPLVLMGPGIKPGRYHRRAAVNDVAPTLATLLEVEVPSGATGRVLDEALR
jgi:arylsulfatase A-like enzyme